jgi:hypothetical protein
LIVVVLRSTKGKPMSFAFKTAKKLLDHVLDLDYFQPDGKQPPPITYHRVTGRDPLVVMVGDNASGKSFARRLVCAVARKAEVEAIHISMERRAGGDVTGGMRGFIYGTEDWKSTGENSVGTVLGGIRTCQGREKPHVMFWDEPDIGLSDSWSAGMGLAIHKFVSEIPEHTKAVFVVTHSKPLIAQLLDLKPHYVYFGDDDPPKTLQDWFERPVVARDIEQLGKLSHARFLRIQKILDRVEKRRA